PSGVRGPAFRRCSRAIPSLPLACCAKAARLGVKRGKRKLSGEDQMTGSNAMKRGFMLTIALALFLAGAGLAQEHEDMRSAADVPLTDGLSAVRVGVIADVDVANERITVGQRSYRLLPNQNEILAQIVGEGERSLVDDVDLGKLRAGDQIRYAVDEMGLGDDSAELFVLGVEK